MDAASKSCDFPDTSKTPVDSAKKRPGRRFVPGGLAQRLQRLVQRERSEVTFWEHKTRTMKPAEEGVAGEACACKISSFHAFHVVTTPHVYCRYKIS